MDTLPDAALLKIFNTLPAVPCLLKLTVVCKRWHALLQHPDNRNLWRYLTLSNSGASDEVSRRLVERARKELLVLNLGLDIQYISMNRGGHRTNHFVFDVTKFLFRGQIKRRRSLESLLTVLSPVDFLDWVRFEKEGFEKLRSLGLLISFHAEKYLTIDSERLISNDVFGETSRALKGTLKACGPKIQEFTLAWWKPNKVNQYERMNPEIYRVELLGLTEITRLLCFDEGN